MATIAEDAPPSRFRGGGGSMRDPRLHQLVLEAARELLVEVGYTRLTVEAVAQRAGVGKPTIYRWWPNKAAIVDEAIWRYPSTTPEDTGDLEVDLRAHITLLVRFFSRPEVAAALPGLLGDARANSGRLVGEYASESNQPIRDRLEAAKRRGELRDSVDVGMVTDILIGALISRVVGRTIRRRSGSTLREGDVDALLDIVLSGIQA